METSTAILLVELPALNLDDRPFIDVSRMQYIQQAANTHQADEEDTRPVEVNSGDLHAVWPEAPEERPNRVDKGRYVDREAPPAQRPARVRQWLATQAFEGHAADGDDVGCHESDGAEGEEGVEGDGAANVDHGHDDGEAAGEHDAVCGDVPGFVDLGRLS
jgi:hypothetical protein